MDHDLNSLLENAVSGKMLSDTEGIQLSFAALSPLLLETATALRDQKHHDQVSYSRKVFIPLTHLCRDFCHYCTFAQKPRNVKSPYLSPEEVLKIAEDGKEAGCKEALFTLGDKPELQYKAARDGLANLGHETTLSYLADMAEMVFKETGLLPHLNPGLMNVEDLASLRRCSVSMGIMLETSSNRLGKKGGPHHGSPDKIPARRLETIRMAGEAAIPFTSGILIGIGETRQERIESLLVLRNLHRKYGHIQEIIIQNFRAKPNTRMAQAPEPDLSDMLWTLAVARILFGAEMNIQAPPNLNPGTLPQIIGAGINDWGGVSPVTPDFVNPEAPWPHLKTLENETLQAGKILLERLAIYPEYAKAAEQWLDPELIAPVLQMSDGQGFARTEDWSAGVVVDPPQDDLERLKRTILSPPNERVQSILDKATRGEDLTEIEIVHLFQARSWDFAHICNAADQLRKQVMGEKVTYVVNRNINYTNVCYFRCQFCAFSKGKMSENLRGRPYNLTSEEIMRRTREAWERGATEVCLQGGIHPEYTGQSYLDICHAIKEAVPEIHIHAFSPLEVWQGAHTLGIGIDEFLIRLRDAGLGTLPGTAAEILDDEVRATLCPDKIKTDQWFKVIETAHDLGIKTTSTIMFGHIENYVHWARHLLRVRALQKRTGGFTEFVPLPFIHMEAPIYLKGRARKGPTFREAVLIHAVARLALHPHVKSIQASWTKLGHKGAQICLRAGVNDLGGTLMNETITRAAGASHGQETLPQRMEELIRSIGRIPEQRTTDYSEAPSGQVIRSFNAPVLEEALYASAKHFERREKKPLYRPGLDEETSLLRTEITSADIV